MFQVLQLQRSVKHSHLYKANDGSNTNAYISKKFLGENPPERVYITTETPPEVKETPK